MTLRLSFQRSQPGCHPGQRTICSSIVSRSRPFPGRGAARRQRIRFAEPVRGEGATPDTPLRHGSTSGQLPGRLGPPLRRRGRRSPRCEVATPGTRSSRRSTRATCRLLSAQSTQPLGGRARRLPFGGGQHRRGKASLSVMLRHAHIGAVAPRRTGPPPSVSCSRSTPKIGYFGAAAARSSCSARAPFCYC